MRNDDRGYFDGDPLSEEILALIKPELAPGERLLWAARAQARSRFGDRSRCVWAAGLFLISAICLFPVTALARFLQRETLVVLEIAGVLSGIMGLLAVIATISNWIENGIQQRRIAPERMP